MFKKFISLFLALVISLSTVTVFAYAENEEAAPSKREQLPVKIEFAYAPLKSRIVISNFGPLFCRNGYQSNLC